MEEMKTVAAEPAVNGVKAFDLQTARSELSLSSTSRRIAQLETLQQKAANGGLSGKDVNNLFAALFDTYAFYNDRASRKAVQRCLAIMFSDPSLQDHLSPAIGAIATEAAKPGIAPVNAFVLVEWTSLLLQRCAESQVQWKRWGFDLLLAQARVLELSMGSTIRESVKHSALLVARQGLRKLFAAKAFGEDAVKDAVRTLIAAGSSSVTVKNAVLLGVIAGVCARLKGAHTRLEACEDSYYTFYLREIVGSHTVVPPHIATAFHDFFSSFTTVEKLQKDIVPALEKSLLRAPEIVLDGVITALVKSLPPKVDLSEILHARLLKPLLSNVKSTNAAIRQGALLTFETIVTRCQDESMLDRIAGEILEPLRTSKISNADQRVVHAKLLTAIPSTLLLASKVPTGVGTTASKEPNEAALSAESEAMVKHMSYGLSQGRQVEKAVLETFVRGLADKKIPMRELWAQRTGELLWGMDAEIMKTAAVLSFANAVAAKLFDFWTETVSNPLPAAQSGLIIGAYVVTAIFNSRLIPAADNQLSSTLKSAEIMKQALMVDPKPSFLLNHRIYTKLTADDDLIWFLRSLISAAEQVSTTDLQPDVSEAWAQAIIFVIAASTVKPNVRRLAVRGLMTAYVRHPKKLGKIILAALWNWRCSIELGEKDTAAVSAKTGLDRLYLVVDAISPLPAEAEQLGDKIETEILDQQLGDMLVLCRPELLPRVNWIETCQRVGIDPGDLVRRRSSRLLEKIFSISQGDSVISQSQMVKHASYVAAAELAFVAPDVITDALVQQFSDDLDPEKLAHVGATEAAIFRTPEGTAFVDVLANKANNQVPDKNLKDYDTLKWEGELRAQLAQKRGQQKKLTAEEQSKVKAQIAKESTIRHELATLHAHMTRGVGIIETLATGPPTAAETWMGRALEALLRVIAAGAGLLIGDAASNAYLACAEQVTPRLGTLRVFIGVATLRALGKAQLRSEYEQEPVGDLVTRVLYRLRFMGEQRPFDKVSLLYILPLVFCVLEQGGVGKPAVEERDEQVVLSLEFLSFHADFSSDPHLPRKDTIATLVSSMQKYNQHYKLIKDCLLELCRCIAPNITDAESQVLIKGIIVPEVSVRTSVLQAINAELDLTDLDFSEEIWLAYHDDADENRELARSVWEQNALDVEEDSVFQLVRYLDSPDKQLRRATARAMAASVGAFPMTFEKVMSQLQEIYRDKAKPLLPQYDEYGMHKKVALKDPWEIRDGFALAFKELSTVFDESSLVAFMTFLIDAGPLGDRNTSVRDGMVEAATSVITAHAKNHVEELMGIFEKTLEAPDSNSDAQDWINEAVIILYGALARHLDAGDARVPKVVQRLLATLRTPSETVQYAVAECLPPLVRAFPQSTSEYVQQMLDQLFQSEKYAARRGAAYGLAGIVHGKGISALREYRIMSALKSAGDNKKDPNHRQGALLAYELLSLILGRIFEPYVIQLVPQLLSSFGDASADVREACLDTAKTCFSHLSSFGVKQILPTLLEGLDEQQWRSKKGACDLLGAMAYLDPQQLALSLPDIIPPLTNVLNDSHKEVRASANRSLQRFGEVISNPEVKGLVGILLKALSDPTKYTDDALDALIKVSFVHYLDSPSLALIVRILERGLGDRSATKRKAAQIIGSLAHLAERKNLIMHLPILTAGLKLAIVDPVPTTRATASKALGSLVEKLGEDALPDLIPGLMSTLKSNTGAGDRLGSAQALAEVLAGLGTTRLEETLPTILQNVSSSKSSVREGFMSLFIFLPACFGNSFAVYLNKIIPPILAGLADDIESIRDTSLRAGRLLVKNFATRAIDLLLPELERGLADASHRIRLSSVELVGDLLFNLTGISAKAETDEAEDGAGEAGQSLLDALGEDKRNKVLSSLYICRCDTSGLVRSAAINVWKALVATPRTLKELIPTLTQLIISRLASPNLEQKVIAGNALGELIRKAGEGVLASLLPTLEEGLQTSTDTDAKQGICIALRELISSASSDGLEEYEKTLISVVRTALVDPNPEVREAAAEAFDSLQQIFGKRAVDQVLPYLLNLLRTEAEADNALAALLTLLTETTRSNIILPNLIPTLLTSPISSFNAKALASLSQVAGSAMVRRLPNILTGLMDNLVLCKDEALRDDLDHSFDAVLSSVDEHDGLNTAMSVMLALVKHDHHRKRAAADKHLAVFFAHANIDFSRYYQDLIRVLLISLDDRDPEVVQAACHALSELMKRLKKEDMESLVPSTRQVLQGVGVAGSNLPGFALPKGINAILPIFLQGLMNGTAEQRTQSALAISDIIDRTSGESLRPFVTQITGPLIRVVSERSVDVKAAILLTLNNLLEKIPTYLKPFLPQLQRTFAKSLADTSSDVLRARAAKALGTLITLTPRIDPLIAELVTGSKTADSGVKNAMLKALYEVVSKAGGNMNEASRASVLGLISIDIDEADDAMAITNARLLGALIKHLSPESAHSLIKQRILTTHFTKASVLGLNAVLLEAPQSMMEGSFSNETPSVICQGIRSKNPFVADNCVLAAGKLLLSDAGRPSFENAKAIFETLAAVIAPGNPVDTRRLALVVVRTVSRLHVDMIKPQLPLLAPPIFASVRDLVIPVKLSAEAAFLAIFSVVEAEGLVFEKYIANAGSDLPPTTKKSMQDYFKRVALRLGTQARERREAEGGQGGLGLSGDARDDEREVWSVGKVDLGEGPFGDE